MAHLQPLLHELVTTLAAPTQVLSDRTGQLSASMQRPSVQGVLHADIRVVSVLELTVLGRPPEHLTSTEDEGSTTFVSLIRRGADADGSDPQLRLDRRREVAPGSVRETLRFSSAAPVEVELPVALTLGSDGAPMAALRSGAPWPPGAVAFAPTAAGLSWSVAGLRVQLVAEQAEVQLRGDQATLAWTVRVPAGGQVSVSWQLSVEDPEAAVGPAAGEPLPVSELVNRLLGPSATSGLDPRLRPWLTRSLADLNSLRMATPEYPDDAFFAAGSPWYLTLFGRDSLWTARLLLPVDVRHAGSTLRALARRQGTRVDPDSAEAPGKILHELRREEFAFGDITLPPVYFGTIDATLLWVCLLHDAWRAGLADEDVRALLPACRAALDWLADASAAAPDGFLAYLDTSGHGLSNQGWKDSSDSIRYADGRVATGPVALVEVQGYAYEAALSGAALLDAFGLPGAERHRAWAQRFAERFRASYWCGSGEDRFPALALDGQQRRVDSLTSNIGHLLGTGLLSAEEELLVARRLASPELDSGLGLRTMSSADAGYWPLSYHCGSVWPHDTAIAIAGLARAGLLEHAAGLVEGLLQAGLLFGGRLPELWSGEGGDAVPYPAACRPQAWSAAASVTVAAALQQRPGSPPRKG